MTDTTPPANLTPDEFNEWQVACAATPGPYRTVSHYQQPFCWETIGVGECVPDCTNEHHRDPCKSDILCENANQHSNARNFALNADPTIVHARLRELSDLRGQVAALTAERERLRGLGNAVESAQHAIEKHVGRKGVAERFIRSRDALDELLAALRTTTGTARLDTEGENDGME